MGQEAAENVNYPISSLLASDPRSEIIAIADPPPANYHDTSFWLVSSATLQQQHIDTLLNRSVSALAVGDIDGDGQADALAIERSSTLLDAQIWVQREAHFIREDMLSTRVSQLLNTIPVEQDQDRGILITRTPVGVALTDMDQDGHLDILLLSRQQGKKSPLDLAVHLLLNLGDGNLAGPIGVPLPDNIHNDFRFADAQLMAADINGDGAPDLVLTAFGGPIAIVRQLSK